MEKKWDNNKEIRKDNVLRMSVNESDLEENNMKEERETRKDDWLLEFSFPLE